MECRTRARQILRDLNMENKIIKDLSKHEIISLRDEVSKYLIDCQLVIFLSQNPFFSWIDLYFCLD